MANTLTATQAPAPPSTRRITELDGLRALAIFAVFGFHFPGFASLLGGVPEFGWLGVDVFFALSGFLITRILLGLRTRPTPYRTFYARRAIRIFPPYVAVQLLILALGLFLHDHAVFTRNYLVHQLLFLQAFASVQAHFLYQLFTHPAPFLHPFHAMAASRPLPPEPVGLRPTLLGPAVSFWSLSVEEYFYLLWAPVVLRLARRNIVVLGGSICILCNLLRFLAPANVVSWFGILLRWDAMMYGALLALLFDFWKRRNRAPWSATGFRMLFLASIATLAAILLYLRPVLGRDVRASNLFAAFGLTAIAVASAALVGLLVLGAGGSWWFARLLRTPALQFIGTISYTMYLVHIFVGLLVQLALERWAPRFSAGPHYELTLALLSVVFTVALARLSWHFLESPLLRWKDRHVGTPAAPAEPALR